IEDQLNEGGFREALDEFIEDYCTYPTAILKGPVVRKKPRLRWGEAFQPMVIHEMVRHVCRVSPYDIFPSRNSRGPNDGYICERHRTTAKTLNDLIGVPGYNAAEIVT